jgi:GNAT superfamily N-acetyltransferase
VPDTKIVEAQLDQLDIVVQLWTELMKFHWERDDRFATREDAADKFMQYAQQYIERDDSMLLLAFVDDQPAGYVTARCAESPPVFVGNEVVILEDLIISQPFRRLGLGKILTQRVIEWAQSLGRDNVQLQVAECNPEGHKFWREMGFREVTRSMRFELGVNKGWDQK